jgi:hypothetical protein
VKAERAVYGRQAQQAIADGHFAVFYDECGFSFGFHNKLGGDGWRS